MAAITAALVGQLRERTGMGMMECKRALTEADGDIEAALTILRQKGAKERDRVAGEGLVMSHVSDDGKTGVLLELNSETDFVARNEDFKALGRAFAQKAANSHAESVEELLKEAHEDADLADPTIAGAINAAINRIGEKIELGRFVRFTAPADGHVTEYVHSTTGGSAEGGRVGVLVETLGANTEQVGREVAMHISFAKPKFLSEDEIDPAVLEKESAILTVQANEDPKMAGKPEAARAAMIDGRLKKFKGEIALLSQPYIRDEKKTIAQLVSETPGASITRFARFEVGENAPKSAE